MENNPSDFTNELLSNNAAASFIFVDLALRGTNSRVTKTDTFEKRLGDKKVYRPLITKCWKSMESANLGDFIEGRHGRPSRFVWKDGLNSKDFCAQAILNYESA